jgi:DNA-directed RNA polymerase specialized sigma24 family protein
VNKSRLGRGAAARQEAAGPQADKALRALYDDHYRELTQLAALLIGDLTAADEVAQDAFVAMHRASRLLASREAALLYLRRRVVRRARSRRWRCAGAAERTAQPQWPGGSEPQRVIELLGTLPVGERESVILSCWAGLSEVEIAEVTGARLRIVAADLKRGLAVLAADPGHNGTVGHRPARWDGKDLLPRLRTRAEAA